MGVAVVVGIARVVPETRDATATPGNDPWGVVLSALGMGGIVFALIESSWFGWTRQASGALSPVPFALVGGVLALVAFVVLEVRRAAGGRHALVDLSLLRVRTFRAGIVAALIVAFGEFGLLFTLPLLLQARQRFTQKQLARNLGVSAKTVGRWESRETPCPLMLEAALKGLLAGPAGHANGNASFTFIDLFAGIGGVRLGFEAAGGQCVFTSEWNEWSKKTYLENFPGDHPFVGDIVPYLAEEVPDHDVLLA